MPVENYAVRKLQSCVTAGRTVSSENGFAELAGLSAVGHVAARVFADESVGIGTPHASSNLCSA